MRLRQQEREKGKKSKKRICRGRVDSWQRTTKTEDGPADLHMHRIPEFHSSTLKNGWQRREGPDDSFLDVSTKKREVTDVSLHQLQKILPFSPG